MFSSNFQKSTFIRDIYIARKHLMYYLNNLGFDVSEFNQFNLSEINAMSQKNSGEFSELDFLVSNPDKGTQCYVKYNVFTSTLKQSDIENYVMDFYEENDKEKTSLIIVSLNPANDTIQKVVKQMWKKYQEYVVIMDLKSLQFNILKHSYVPLHEKLENQQKKEMYEKYNISHSKQLPEISMFDPVAKVLLLRPDEVCKITRYDKISMQNEFYRICVI